MDVSTLVNGNYHTAEDLIPDRTTAVAGMPELPRSVQHDDTAADLASPWLNAYIDFSKIWSPRAHDDFHESIGIWLLSTVAARRVALHFGGTRYTNLYIALASRTSVFAKSTTANIAQDILRQAHLSYLLAPDDATPQAFVRNMTQRLPDGWTNLDRDSQELIKRKIAFAAQKGWFFDEFGQKVSSMMRDGGFMSDFRSLLRKFDDTPDVYEYQTVGRGDDIVRYPYLALLANLTPADLKPHAKKHSQLWGDGFFARFAFLTPPDGAPRKNERFPRGERVIPASLTTPLSNWHYDLGIPDVDVLERETDSTIVAAPLSPQISQMDDSVFDAYYRYSDALIDIVTKSELTDLDGNYTRLPEKALRVAMLLASLENNGHIQMKHWHRAQRVSEMWRRNLHNLYVQVVDSETSATVAMEDKIMRHIADKGPRTVRELCQGIRGLDTGQAKGMVKMMTDAGFLAIMKDGRKEMYRLEVEQEV